MDLAACFHREPNAARSVDDFSPFLGSRIKARIFVHFEYSVIFAKFTIKATCTLSHIDIFRINDPIMLINDHRIFIVIKKVIKYNTTDVSFSFAQLEERTLSGEISQGVESKKRNVLAGNVFVLLPVNVGVVLSTEIQLRYK